MESLNILRASPLVASPLSETPPVRSKADETNARNLLDALDLHGFDSPQRLPREDVIVRPATISETPWWWIPQHNHLLVEGASIRHQGPTSGGGMMPPQTQQVWHSHLAPQTRVVVRPHMQLESTAYVVAVQDDIPVRGLPPAHLMVGKVHPFGIDDALTLQECFNRKLSLNFFKNEVRTVPHVLRDAVFSRMVNTPSYPRRILMAPASLMTLHPLADGDLQHLLAPLKRVGDALCEAFTRHVALALLGQLTCLEELDVVHCDIKPHNILFWADGTVALNDFGSAYGRWEERLLSGEGVITSPAYQAFDEEMVARNTDMTDSMTDSTIVLPWPHGKDVYSAGVTLLFLASGIHPFNLPDSTTDLNAICARQDLWRRIYGDIEAFARGNADRPRLQAANIGDAEVDRARAVYFARAFALLRKRAPSLVPLVCSMLHPLIDSRPHAHELLQALVAFQPRQPLPDGSVQQWLSLVASGVIARHLRNMGPVAKERTLGLPRRQTFQTGASHTPWDFFSLSGATMLQRKWAIEIWMNARTELLRSQMAGHASDEIQPERSWDTRSESKAASSGSGSAFISPLRRSSWSMLSAGDSTYGLPESA